MNERTSNKYSQYRSTHYHVYPVKMNRNPFPNIPNNIPPLAWEAGGSTPRGCPRESSGGPGRRLTVTCQCRTTQYLSGRAISLAMSLSYIGHVRVVVPRTIVHALYRVGLVLYQTDHLFISF